MQWKGKYKWLIALCSAQKGKYWYIVSAEKSSDAPAQVSSSPSCSNSHGHSVDFLFKWIHSSSTGSLQIRPAEGCIVIWKVHAQAGILYPCGINLCLRVQKSGREASHRTWTCSIKCRLQPSGLMSYFGRKSCHTARPWEVPQWDLVGVSDCRPSGMQSFAQLSSLLPLAVIATHVPGGWFWVTQLLLHSLAGWLCAAQSNVGVLPHQAWLGWVPMYIGDFSLVEDPV